MQMRMVAGSVLALLTGAATPMAAQGTVRSNTTGVFIGFDLNGASIDVNDPVYEIEESGGGATFRLGYGFTPLFSLHIGGTGTNLEVDGESVTMGHGDIMARFSFGNVTQAFRPYLELGFAHRTLTIDDFVAEDDQGASLIGELEVSGGALAFGGGFHYFFNPKWALNVGLNIATGEFNTVRFDNVSISDVVEVDGTTARLNVGITWFPMSPR
ncbi:MAG TPA: outer membrane beta-barrel protein [Gemmatimonadaceae bacterium]